MTQPISDTQLDLLLNDAARREQTLRDIQRQTMQLVRQEARRVRVKRLVRLVVLCFGTPLLLLLPLLSLVWADADHSLPMTVSVCVGLLFYYVPVVMRLNEAFNHTFVR